MAKKPDRSSSAKRQVAAVPWPPVVKRLADPKCDVCGGRGKITVRVAEGDHRENYGLDPCPKCGVAK